MLLQHGADPQASDAEQRTALFYAARANRAGHDQGAAATPARRSMHAIGGATTRSTRRSPSAPTQPPRELRSLGLHANLVTADPARHSGKFDPSQPGRHLSRMAALALAVARNDEPSVQQLLAAGGDANLRVPQGDPLLQVAADAHAVQVFHCC